MPEPNPTVPTEALLKQLSLAQMREIVGVQLTEARKTLSTLRGKRDALNKEISHQVAEVEELERVDRQLNAKPRTKAKKGPQ